MIRIVLVDDHPMMREGVRAAIDRCGGMKVVGEANSAQGAVRLVREHSPDLVVMDVRLPDADGLETCAMLNTAGTPARVVILTQYINDRTLLRAFRAGVRGYVVKTCTSRELCRAFQAVAEGKTYVDPRVAEKLVKAATKQPQQKLPYGLTPQEYRVLELLPRGFTNQQIAGALSIGVETAKTHLRHAMRKLCVSDRWEAAEIVRKLNLEDWE